jgi:WD40 repeat protein
MLRNMKLIPLSARIPGFVLLQFLAFSICSTTPVWAKFAISSDWKGVQWSPDGKLAAAVVHATADRTEIAIYDAKTLLRLPLSFKEALAEIRWSPDSRNLAGKNIFSPFNNEGFNSLVVLDSKTGHEVGRLPDKMFHDYQWSPRETLIAIASPKGAFIWKIGETKAKSLSTDGEVGRVAWSPDGTLIAWIITQKDATRFLEVYSVQSGEIIKRMSLPSIEYEEAVLKPGILSWSKTGQWLACSYCDGFVHLCDANNFIEVTKLSAAEKADCCWCPEGDKLAYLGADDHVHIFHPKAMKELTQIVAGELGLGLMPIAWSPDNIHIALWDIRCASERSSGCRQFAGMVC